jgi:Rrf2 family protein
MKVRRESKYGLEGLVFLAQQPRGRVVGLKEIAARQGLPEHFLAKIFPKFVRYRIVRAYRGATRGYALARAPEEIRLREILEAIEGPAVTNQCFFWGSECDLTNPCPVHCRWREIRPLITDILERTTLQELILKQQMISAATDGEPPPPGSPAARARGDGGPAGGT